MITSTLSITHLGFLGGACGGPPPPGPAADGIDGEPAPSLAQTGRDSSCTVGGGALTGLAGEVFGLGRVGLTDGGSETGMATATASSPPWSQLGSAKPADMIPVGESWKERVKGGERKKRTSHKREGDILLPRRSPKTKPKL